MERLHARYPFLSGARQAVREADIDLAELVAGDHPAVDRGRERVEQAIDAGTVGEPRQRARVELLSYPIARVLVSLVDEPALTRRYARAEARAAAERLREDAAGAALQSAGRVRLSLRELLAEFDLASATREREEGFDLAVTSYLALAAGKDDDGWRLVNRDLADGIVPVAREELFALVETAVEDRVASALPFAVPEPIASELDAVQSELRDRLAEFDVPREIDAVVPEQFPPCIGALVEQIRDGEDLPHHARFAATAFLATIGMDAEEVVAFYGDGQAFDAERTRYQVAHVGGDAGAVEYAPPSCETMQAFGNCVDAPDRCESIGHPVAAYEAALDGTATDADWRDSQTRER